MPSELNPSIHFEDQHLCVVSKPAGLLSQDDVSGEPSLVTWAREHFGRNYVGLVHRLDRNTSGLMVLAKRTKSAERLTQALQNGQVLRAYLAWCRGNVPTNFEWRHFILKDEKNNLSIAYKETRTTEKREAKLAQLNGTNLFYSKNLDASLCRFVLETGRSHQIRAQAKTEGHSLLGDRKYGGETSVLKRPALHSYYLKFTHPMSQSLLEFFDILPQDLTPEVVRKNPQWQSLNLKNPPL